MNSIIKQNNTYKFHNYTLTTEILEADSNMHPPQEILDALTETYTKVLEKDKSIIVKLLHLIEKYPDIPQFKNYLGMYYYLHDEKEKAYNINRKLMEEFPDYLYAKLSVAEYYLENEMAEKVPAILGTAMELAALYPERKIFYFDEFICFNRTVIEYYCEINEMDKAERILQNLYEVDELLELDYKFDSLENFIMLSRLRHLDINWPSKIIEPGNERESPTLAQTKKQPVFHYPQISWLYQYGFDDMEDEKINELLSLDKEWLSMDLEAVVYDAIKRFVFFNKKADDEPLDSCMNALYLLKEIKAEKSLPVVLELLRQPKELIELWLGDLLTDNIWQVIYTLGINQTSVLSDFLKEPLNYPFARTEVSEALSQLALHNPERRNEIIQLYKEVIDHFFSNKNDTTIINETVIGFIIAHLIELDAKELLPEIKSLFEEDLVDHSVNGNYKEVLDAMGEDYDKDEYKNELQNYFEIKEEIKSWNEENDFDDDGAEWDNVWEDAEIVNKEDETKYFYSGDTPFVRETPKVGRNEPCPCGSGKKYKKCHGKDE